MPKNRKTIKKAAAQRPARSRPAPKQAPPAESPWPHVQACLSFDGRCDEALQFYQRALGAEVKRVMRFKDHPNPAMWPPGSGERVMHAVFQVGSTRIMAADGPDGAGKPKFEGFSLTLEVETSAEAGRFFAALADGGQVRMPLAETFFSPSFGMVADRFGVLWMVVSCR